MVLAISEKMGYRVTSLHKNFLPKFVPNFVYMSLYRNSPLLVLILDQIDCCNKQAFRIYLIVNLMVL